MTAKLKKIATKCGDVVTSQTGSPFDLSLLSQTVMNTLLSEFLVQNVVAIETLCYAHFSFKSEAIFGFKIFFFEI